MEKHTYIDAVFDLGHRQFLMSLPHNDALTEEEYNSAYSEITGVGDDGTAILSTDPDDFTISYAEAHAKFEELVGGEAIAELRDRRNELLHDSDWTQNADSPLDAGTKSGWATYRQALRDITENYTSLDDVVWPENP